MDIIYILKLKITKNAYPIYKRCIQTRIEGNASIGIKGMMEVTYKGRAVFPSVELFTTDLIGEHHLLTIKGYTDDMVKLDYYLEHYSEMLIRNVPEADRKRTLINSFIEDETRVIPIAEIDEEFEELYKRHLDDMYNFASFEIFG